LAEALPGARGALQRLLLARARGERDHLAAAVREDRCQVALAEAAGGRRGGERLIDLVAAVELGERDGLGDLAPQPGRAGRSRGDQPPLRAGPDLRNARSSRVPAFGRRSSAPVGLGG
jgi:hypothetical protein